MVYKFYVVDSTCVDVCISVRNFKTFHCEFEFPILFLLVPSMDITGYEWNGTKHKLIWSCVSFGLLRFQWHPAPPSPSQPLPAPSPSQSLPAPPNPSQPLPLFQPLAAPPLSQPLLSPSPSFPHPSLGRVCLSSNLRHWPIRWSYYILAVT